MSSGILFIGVAEQKKIDDAIARARTKPLPWGALQPDASKGDTLTLNLADRQDMARIAQVRRDYPSQHLTLGTYQVAFSFEYQPAGLMRHLSVSSARSDKVPGPAVMEMICRAFGFQEKVCIAMGRPSASVLKPERPVRCWIEEFMPGHHAINIIELVEEDGTFAVSEALRTDPDAAP